MPAGLLLHDIDAAWLLDIMTTGTRKRQGIS